MISSFDLNSHSEYNDNYQHSILAMSQNNLSKDQDTTTLMPQHSKPPMRKGGGSKQFKMSNRDKSSNSNQSGLSSIRDSKVSTKEYTEYNRQFPKRSHTLKQENQDRVIEENSEFNESGNGYASDTPVAGKKKRQ